MLATNVIETIGQTQTLDSLAQIPQSHIDGLVRDELAGHRRSLKAIAGRIGPMFGGRLRILQARLYAGDQLLLLGNA